MNSVSPGPVATPILADFIKTLGPRVEDDLKLNRAATADEIAPVVAFLLLGRCAVDERRRHRRRRGRRGGRVGARCWD